MMFAGPKLKVALATVHVPLAEVPRALTTDRVRTTIELRRGIAACATSASRAPRIGVVGLNPHAGRRRPARREDADVIAPALARAVRAGHRCSGPLVPDAAFRDALHGSYDALVAMYHDQGLIPVKLVDFDEAVNVTLGLPIVRTSPDHGTAYDIAGKGIARAISMQRAALTRDARWRHSAPERRLTRIHPPARSLVPRCRRESHPDPRGGFERGVGR